MDWLFIAMLLIGQISIAADWDYTFVWEITEPKMLERIRNARKGSPFLSQTFLWKGATWRLRFTPLYEYRDLTKLDLEIVNYDHSTISGYNVDFHLSCDELNKSRADWVIWRSTLKSGFEMDYTEFKSANFQKLTFKIQMSLKSISMKDKTDTDDPKVLKKRIKQLESANHMLTLEINGLKDDQKECELVKAENIKLKHEIKLLKRGNMNENDFKKWNSEEIAIWISSIKPEYKQYEQTLRMSLSEEQVSGEDLVSMNEMNVKMWGIKIFKHRKDIMEHIQKLIGKRDKKPLAEECDCLFVN